MDLTTFGGICGGVGAIVGIAGYLVTRAKATSEAHDKAHQAGKAEGIMESGFRALTTSIDKIREELIADRMAHNSSIANIRETIDRVAEDGRKTNVALQLLDVRINEWINGFEALCQNRHELPTGQHEAYPPIVHSSHAFDQRVECAERTSERLGVDTSGGHKR